MKIALRRFFVSAQIGALVAIAPTIAPTTSYAEEAEDADIFAKAFDLTVLRPLGSIKLVVGMTALIPAAFLYSFRIPFDSDASALEEVAEILVIEPANYVFRRPLGEDFQGQ